MKVESQYYFVLGSQNFLLIHEPFEEVLRERVEYYRSIKKRLDFWLLPSPQFLELSEFQFVKTECPTKNIALVSTNKNFVTWLKLRFNNVILGEFTGPSSRLKSPLAYNYFY